MHVSGRLVPIGVALLLACCVAGAIVSACYQLPEPDCGFLCGTGGTCPDHYTCASDHHCHKIGTPDTLVCGTPDAAVDAPPDAPPDSPTDAPADAATDAAADAPPDT